MSRIKDAINEFIAEEVAEEIRNDGIDRSRYVYEGPNGTPRNRRDYSPNERLRQPLPIIPLSYAEPIDTDPLARAPLNPPIPPRRDDSQVFEKTREAVVEHVGGEWSPAQFVRRVA